MSNTHHHKGQKNQHCGHDYGGKYKHNKHYGGGYGVDGRDAADSERRQQSKDIIASELDELNGVDDVQNTDVHMELDECLALVGLSPSNKL